MVKKFGLSENTIASVLKDLEDSDCEDITGVEVNAPVFVLIPSDDNQVSVGVDPRLEEVEFGDKALLPKSLISAAIFVGEGSHHYYITVDGVPISVKVQHN